MLAEQITVRGGKIISLQSQIQDLTSELILYKQWQEEDINAKNELEELSEELPELKAQN